MIPALLQDYLVEEVKTLFTGFTLKNVNGEEVAMNVYPQYLPARTGQKDTAYYPFIVVKLLGGDDPNETDPNQCRILFYCGVFDDAENYQGHKDCLTVMQKIYDHLMRNLVFGNKYEVEYPIKWALTDEDFYPYYYGGLETTWTVGKITRLDDEFC
jgi:hypothetical protein